MPFAGRGGAGNIQTFRNENARAALDLEANHPSGEPDDASSRTEQQYAYKGRGGAGNYYSPRDLKEQGTYRDTNMSQTIGDGLNTLGSDTTSSATQHNKTLGSETTRTYGRGGAGNFMFDASENQERALQKTIEEETSKRAKIQADVEQGVSDSLAPPPKARLSRGRQDRPV